MKFCKICSAIVLLTMAAAGCSTLGDLPAGSQLQSSTFGLRLSPSSIDGAPLTLGSHTFIATTAQPEGAFNLNRFQAVAPMGINIRSTVATGDVGEQIREAGGPEALRYLLGPGDAGTPPAAGTLPAIPIPLPRTDVEGTD